MVTNNTIKFDENLLSNLLFVEFRPSLLVNDIFEREESTSERDSVILSFDPSVIPPFLFASCTRARKKNIGGTRSDATETLPRGKFRPG